MESKKFITKFEMFCESQNKHSVDGFENKYSANVIGIGDFLKHQFPDVKFVFDEESTGWWTTDKNILNKYSSERSSYNYEAEEDLKRRFRSQNYGQKLIVNSDYDKIQFTLD